MDQLWVIINGWEPIVQFLFFVVLASLAVGGFARLMFYGCVFFHGWPEPTPCNCKEESAEDDEYEEEWN